MTHIRITGEFDIDPGQTIQFGAADGESGYIDVYREHDLPLTDVRAAGPIHDAYAVGVHADFISNRTWQHTDAWFERLVGIGVRTIRGKVNPNNAGCRRALELCRTHGVKWIATFIPEDDGYGWTKAQVQSRARFLGEWSDVVTAVELMNEPDHRRSGHPPVPSDWPDIMVRHAQWVREILPNAWIVSCSLHAGVDTFERDWQRLDAAGLAPLINSIGIHDYDNGFEPCQRTDWRIQVARAAMGDKPVDITEYGYTTSIHNPPAEQNPVSWQAARLYALRGHLDRVVTRGVRYASRFELLGDPDPFRKSTQAGFGVVWCPELDPDTWDDTPESDEVRAHLARLDDANVTGFTPQPIRLAVDTHEAPVEWLVTQTSHGPPVLWLWRPGARVWDPGSRVDLAVAPLDVTVTTTAQTRTVDVAGGVTTVELTEYA